MGEGEKGESRDDFLVSLSGWSYHSLNGNWVLEEERDGENHD